MNRVPVEQVNGLDVESLGGQIQITGEGIQFILVFGKQRKIVPVLSLRESLRDKISQHTCCA